MGTRSNTLFGTRMDGKDNEMVYYAALYRQMDSYPECHGKELKAITNGGKAVILNGFSSDKHRIPEFFNGMDCLAAYAIGKLKGNKIGDIYMIPIPDDFTDQEWVYVVYNDWVETPLQTGKQKPNPIMVRVFNNGKLVYDGKLSRMPVTRDRMLGIKKPQTVKKPRIKKA